MTKYDYRSFVRDNLTERGCCKDGGVFDFGEDFFFWTTLWHGERWGTGNPYSWTIRFTAEIEKEGLKRKRRKSIVFHIVISQDGVGLRDYDQDCDFNDVYKALRQIKAGIDKYAFTPVAYELWSDHPDTPYYVKTTSSLCNRVVLLKEVEE